MHETTIVNIRSGEPFDVYIGRACRRAKDPRCHADSEWCNFYRAGRGLVTTPLHAVRLYERWLRRRVAEDAGMRERLLALRGKRLGCWCAPEPCHGDAIVRVLEELERAEGAEKNAEAARHAQAAGGAV